MSIYLVYILRPFLLLIQLHPSEGPHFTVSNRIRSEGTPSLSDYVQKFGSILLLLVHLSTRLQGCFSVGPHEIWLGLPYSCCRWVPPFVTLILLIFDTCPLDETTSSEEVFFYKRYLPTLRLPYLFRRSTPTSDRHIPPSYIPPDRTTVHNFSLNSLTLPEVVLHQSLVPKTLDSSHSSLDIIRRFGQYCFMVSCPIRCVENKECQALRVSGCGSNFGQVESPVFVLFYSKVDQRGTLERGVERPPVQERRKSVANEKHVFTENTGRDKNVPVVRIT